MQTHSQPAAPPSLWAKLAAALCLLLCLQLAALQSWHTHAAPATLLLPGAPGVSAQSSTADAQDTACPACAAMHLAPLMVAALFQVPVAIAVLPTRSPISVWHEHLLAFHLYSRPPPRS